MFSQILDSPGIHLTPGLTVFSWLKKPQIFRQVTIQPAGQCFMVRIMP
jgi:hypothetical protein